MREIKFRAWIDEELLSHEQLIDMDQETHAMYTIITNEENDEGVKIMQYTGIKDKNGREIYEGDIVEQLSERTYKSVTGTVKLLDGSYVIEFLSGDDGVFLFDEMAYNEVLGNIYENPTLLEESLYESK